MKCSSSTGIDYCIGIIAGAGGQSASIGVGYYYELRWLARAYGGWIGGGSDHSANIGVSGHEYAVGEFAPVVGCDLYVKVHRAGYAIGEGRVCMNTLYQ